MVEPGKPGGPRRGEGGKGASASDAQAPPDRPVASVEEALADIRAGRMVVLIDDADPRNEGALAMAAERVTSGAINFMAMHGRGLVCLTLTDEHMRRLAIAPQPAEKGSPLSASFGVMIDARKGTTTGISASDRAVTILTAVDPNCRPEDLVRPGHVPPLVAQPGGVLARSGRAEGSVDLARLAGLTPAGVICEIMNDDGTMARVPDLVRFCERHALRIVTVADLIEYSRRTEKLVERVVSVRLPTQYGEFTAVAFRELLNGKQHVALVKGEVAGAEDVLVRVHSECLTGDVFHSLRCDCGEQLSLALERLEQEGRGVLLYLAQEGRGIGLLNKLKTYELQENGRDTVEANVELGFPADAREYGIGSQILADLGLKTIRILTNNPKKIAGIAGFGLTVVSQEPLEVRPNDENRRYLDAKREKLGHTLGQKLHHQRLRFDPTLYEGAEQ